MKYQQKLALTQVAAAATLAALQMGAAFAQTATAAQSGGVLNLDEVVITAAPTARSKMKSSDSVSSLGEESITRGGATNAAEILRAIPGIRAESSGGEGNANVTVRGAPISAGGSRYVQFQEDGLPLLLFGDIAFGTPDQFLRTDFMTDRVEVVRGGGASTQATNAPGGVVNFITKNDKESGGAVGYTAGIGNRLNRFDFNLSSPIGKDTYFNIGGFQRQGDGGAIKTNFNSQDGGQIKASVTKDLEGGSYVRVNLKQLNDKTPSLMPVPVTVTNGSINQIAGIDPRNAYFINPNLSRDVTIDKNGNRVASNPADGLSVSSSSLGLEAKFNLPSGWVIDEKIRKTTNSGRFMALFPADNGNNGTSNTFTATLFNTSLDNLDNLFNDIKASKAFDLGGGKSVFTAGLFTGSQNVAETWFWNQYNVQMVGQGAAITGPVSSGWNTWGGCCSRTYDVRYTTTAPYAALSWDSGALSLDGGIRQNDMKATGQTFGGTLPKGASATDLNAGSWDPAKADTVNYGINKTSYSFGGNYALDKDMSLYGRVSDGYNFAADRLLYGSTGALNNQPTAYNELKQQELGVKYRNGNFSLFGTYFMAQTDETNYELTTQKFTANSYDAKGVEIELGYKMGGFRLGGGFTYTDAKISKTADGTNVGNKPRRQADYVYQLTPSYRTGELEFGAAFIGSSDSWADDQNTIKMPGYMVTNLFVNYRVDKHTSVSFGVNNAFDTLAYTEAEGDGHAARALPGRTAKATLKYEF